MAGKDIRLLSIVGMACVASPSLLHGGHAGFIATLAEEPWRAVDWQLERARFSKDRAVLIWKSGSGRLRLRTLWRLWGSEGVVMRRDEIVNAGPRPIVLSRCISALVLAPQEYEAVAQSSRWSAENQCERIRIGSATIEMASEGRSTHGGAPYCAVARRDGSGGIAFHIAPVGNWVLRLRPDTRVHAPAPLVVEAGLADRRLKLKVAPGERIALPQIIMQSLPGLRIEAAAPVLHRALLAEDASGMRREVPIPYNTWFHCFDRIDPALLEPQLVAAKEIGCEVFVVDAGWYGSGPRSWWEMVGDWRENMTAAFRGRMNEFAEHVRDAGLGFGLWIEPERIAAQVAREKRLSTGMVRTPAGQYYPDLTDPKVWQAVLDEIARLIERYELAWVKIDHNHDLDIDPSGSELFRYYEAFARLIEAIKRAYPKTILEGCASGGLRLDLNTLSLFDTHFLSDTVDPVDVLRIGQGAALRVPPCRIAKWIVLGPADMPFKSYASPMPASGIVIAPCGAG